MRKDSFDKLPDYLISEIKRRYVNNPAYGRLPSERELCSELGASRSSIRKALTELDNSGLVRQLPGGRIRHIQRDKWTRPATRPERYFDLHSAESPFPEGIVRAPEPTTIKLLANDLYPGAPQSVVKRWQAELDAFRRSNPAIRVEVTPWEEKLNDFERMRSIDLLELTTSNLRLLAAKELVRPLDFFLSHDTEVLKDKFHHQIWSDVKIDGRIMALPFGVITPGILTNRQTWKRFGNGVPPNSWTWNDFLNVLENCHETTGIKPLRIVKLYALLYSLCHDFVVNINRKQIKNTASLLKRILDVTDLDTRHPRSISHSDNPFFLTITTTGIPNLESQMSGEGLLLPFPVEPDGILPRTTMALMMSSSCQNPVECWQVMRHLVQAGAQRRVGRTHHLVPAVKKAVNSFVSTESSLGDLDFMVDNLERSTPICLDNIKEFKFEREILGPELLRWRQGLNDADTMFLRIQMRLGLLKEELVVIP